MSFSTIILLYGGGQINEIFVILFGLFKRKRICAGFFIVCLYMYIVYVLPLDIQLSGGEPWMVLYKIYVFVMENSR
jgi:hypothetical protein